MVRFCMHACMTSPLKARLTHAHVVQSKEVRQVRMDLRALIAPLFHGLSEDLPVCMARLESKVYLPWPVSNSTCCA